jgi:hypothetical protein
MLRIKGIELCKHTQRRKGQAVWPDKKRGKNKKREFYFWKKKKKKKCF